ncbi:MAG: dienelactone hydrolase family protein [Chlamydiales bacterium]|nr:dienelactone hydrolase family protein [Chlamydiales bacterium]
MFKRLVDYQDGSVELEGYLAYSSEQKQKTVLLCHAWAGRDAYICEKADLIASLGYTAFAIDVYGKNVLGTSAEENLQLKQPFLADRNLLKKRLMKGYEAACAELSVDEDQLVVLGFGFGGLCALDYARYIPTLRGVVCVYGHFECPSGASNTSIKAKVLLLHGKDDPVVPPRELCAFEQELKGYGVDCESHVYPNSMHAFTTPSANCPEKGVAYNPETASQAWNCIQDFLNRVL